MQFVRIPHERVSVLIGEEGSTKREVERRSRCRVNISDGEVSVEGAPLDEWVAKDVVYAIGRGFSPDKALLLLGDGYVFDFIDLSDYANTPKSMERIKGRIIGENGRTRKYIERNTGALVSVYGKTVAFIGSFDSVALAKEACVMLSSGSRHATVYRFIEKKGVRRA